MPIRKSSDLVAKRYYTKNNRTLYAWKYNYPAYTKVEVQVVKRNRDFVNKFTTQCSGKCITVVLESAARIEELEDLFLNLTLSSERRAANAAYMFSVRS